MTTKRWLGNATAISDVWTVSLSGTVTLQTYSMTINGKSVTYAAGTTDTVSSILTGLVAVWNSTTIPEFTELTAAGLPSGSSFTSMTLTQDTAGVPSAISVSTSGAATFTIANTTAATGPNFFNNGQNWSGGAAPANGDLLVFDNGSVNCRYGLNSSLTGVILNVNPGFSGAIGLPFINASGQNSYAEYRTTSLTLAGGTAVINCPTINQCNLAFGANTTTVRVLATGQRASQYIPVVLLTGGNASSELDVSKGDVGVAFYTGQTAYLQTVKTGYITNALSDVSLILGAGCTLRSVIKNGGNLTLSTDAISVTQDYSGGSVTLTDSVSVATLVAYAGTVNLNSVGTIGTILLYGSATLNCDGDPRAKTVTNPIVIQSPNVTVTDNQKSINGSTLTLDTRGIPSANVNFGGIASMVLT